MFEDILEHAINSPRRDPIADQMNLIEKYELTYGIQREGDPNPLALCTMQPSLDYLREGYWEKTVEQLIFLKIPELTNMSISDLLELPRHRLMSLVDSIKRSNARQRQKEMEIENKAEKEGKRQAGKM